MAVTDSANVEYSKNRADYRVVSDLMEGNARTIASRYLRQGTYENTTKFEIRQHISDFHPYTSRLLSNLVGMLYRDPEAIQRSLPSNVVPQVFFRNAGRRGEGFNQLVEEFALNTLAFNASGFIVTPQQSRIPNLSIVSPINVPRWNDTRTVVTSHMTAPGNSITQDEEMMKVWVAYAPDGFEIFKQERRGKTKKDVRISQQDYDHTFTDGNGNEIAPAQRIGFWADASLGAQIAHQHLALYRLRSGRDVSVNEALRSAAIQTGTGNDTDFAEAIKQTFKNDNPFVPYSKDIGEHKPLSLPTGPLEEAREVIKEKEDQLNRIVGNFADESLQTATEIRVRSETGVEAILSTLANFMETNETLMLRIVAQAFNRNVTDQQLQRINVTYPTSFISSE